MKKELVVMSRVLLIASAGCGVDSTSNSEKAFEEESHKDKGHDSDDSKKDF
jgi:hypothetical protein